MDKEKSGNQLIEREKVKRRVVRTPPYSYLNLIKPRGLTRTKHRNKARTPSLTLCAVVTQNKRQYFQKSTFSAVLRCIHTSVIFFSATPQTLELIHYASLQVPQCTPFTLRIQIREYTLCTLYV